jgi:hypothetical protein
MPAYEVESPALFETFADNDVSGSFAPLDRPDDRCPYAFGYEQALQNLLTSLVPLAERHLGRLGTSSAQARKNVYAFIEFLEQHIERASADVQYVADGLGI